MATNVKALDPAQALRDRVIRTIRDHEAELRALGVRKLWLFGSLARGSSTGGHKALLTMVRDAGAGPSMDASRIARALV
jgi:hypothetical protein